MVAEGAASDGSTGMDAEVQAGARLGPVAVEEAEVVDVGGSISEAEAWYRTVTRAIEGSQGGGAGREGTVPRGPLVTVKPLSPAVRRA